ncbi:IS110 family transposase [Mucilaginibacter sp. CAU 1740]|uniref:IS110 family transposase n=1 Tax=Mucilaginibacter sp. CAU 1740 TaxID=3140365 RepID=UPI00325ABA94
MTKILKQVLGIDVAQNELVVSLGKVDQSLTKDIYAYKTFANKPSGFLALLTWVKKHSDHAIAVHYVMEATGVYHDKLAHFLSDQSLKVSIVLPNKISSYMRTLEIKTITDKTASQAICQFGLERSLTLWQKPKKIFRDLKQLTRERDQIVADRVMTKNQLHAEQTEAFPNERSIHRANQRISLLNQQEKEIKKEIAEFVKADKELYEKINLVTSIPGIGSLTAVITIAETNGFNLIRNKKQLVSLAGLDVISKDSGTSVKGKPKISKKGNRHIRKAMHMPSLNAIRNDERFKAVYIRLVSKHGIKMKAAVAVQRKMLEMIYTIWTTGKPYDKEYLQKTIGAV